MKSNAIWWCTFTFLFGWTAFANQYQFSGTVADGANHPITNAVVEVSTPTNPPALKHIALTSTNGQYSLTVNLPQGTTASVYATQSGIYLWTREVVLGTNLVVSNFDFSIPTINSNKLSLTGKITVGGNAPKDTAGIVVQASQSVHGQKLVGMLLVAAAGIQITNAYKFYDLPVGEYTVLAQADSSQWTQTVIAIATTNTPVKLDFNF